MKSQDKINVQSVLLEEVTKKVETLKVEIENLRQDVELEAKSSAGDKHETSLAMRHLELERISGQMIPLLEMIDTLMLINPLKEHISAGPGSLIKMGDIYYYLSVGIGKITVENTEVFCLSPSAPLALSLIGKQKGDRILFNERSMEIEDLI